MVICPNEGSVFIPNGYLFDRPANTRCWPNAGSMLGQRRRRWTNIEPAFGIVYRARPRQHASLLLRHGLFVVFMTSHRGREGRRHDLFMYHWVTITACSEICHWKIQYHRKWRTENMVKMTTCRLQTYIEIQMYNFPKQWECKQYTILVTL